MDKNTLKDAIKTTIEAFEELKSEGFNLNIGSEDLIKVAISLYIQGSRNGNGNGYENKKTIFPLIVNFGKYKGQTLEQILKIDKKYLWWISEKCVNERIKAEAQRLLQMSSTGQDGVTVPKPKTVQR